MSKKESLEIKKSLSSGVGLLDAQDSTIHLKNLDIIREFVKKLSKDFSVHNVIFFGSSVNGRTHKDSDIDLIIVSDDFEGKGFFERVSIMYNYWDAFVAVDFLCYTVKEYEKLKNKISIVREALQNGIIVK